MRPDAAPGNGRRERRAGPAAVRAGSSAAAREPCLGPVY